MNIKNIIFGLIAIMFVIAACEKDFSNPDFADNEIAVYHYGSGNRLGWEEYNLTVGDSLPFKLQVAPGDASYKWMLNDVEVSSTLEYTYKSMAEGNEKLYFVASRASVVDTSIFSINSVLSGEISKLNEWQSFAIENQTGEFTAEFDMVANQDSIDAVTGFLSGISTGFGDLSAIVRFTKDGRLDARNSGSYEFIDDIPYTAGQNLHVRMEVNMGTNTYDVFVTPAGGTEQTLATAYGFRKANTSIDHWAIIYGDWMPVNVNSHRVSNMSITAHSQNEAPIMVATDDQSVLGGTVKEVTVSASDPLGEGIVFTTGNLPRFASFTDNGDGTGTFVFSPYGECGGCDDGNYEIIVNAVNRLHTTIDTFMLSVANNIEVIADLGDAHIYEIPRLVDVVQADLVAGKMDPSWLADYQGESNLCIVLPFLIPEIPAGTQISNIELKLQINGSTSWDSWSYYDMYGINARTDATVLGTDYFHGPYDTDTNTEVTAVEASAIVGNEAVGAKNITSSSLKDFILAQIQNGASGKYVFLRINPTRLDHPTWSTVKIQSSNGTDDTTKPTLVISLAPAK